jgi:hypothetical protein
VTIYQGFDVLEIDADGRFSRIDDHDREFMTLGAGTGRKETVDLAGVSELTRSYTWTGLGLADVGSLKSFMDSRLGRAAPFWLASLEHDMTLNGDFNAGHQFIDIQTIGYVASLWPYSGARRHVFLRPISGPAAPLYRKVTNAVNNLNGTETLYLDSVLGVSVPRDSWMVGFLRLCRLEEDSFTITWSSRGYQNGSIQLRELPLEAPL